ncbi:hypothetical protein CR513_36097, partial [Mucuna pruriens]
TRSPPIKVTFIINRCLYGNDIEKCSTFHNEASPLIINLLINEMPKNQQKDVMMQEKNRNVMNAYNVFRMRPSHDAVMMNILDEYVCMLGEEVMLDRRRVVVMQKKNMVLILLQGMHNVMNAYSVFRRPPHKMLQ